MSVVKVFLQLLLSMMVLNGCATQQTKKPVLNDLKAQQARANQAYMDGNYELAINRYQELQAVLDKDPYIWFRLGNSYSHLKQPDKAIQAYRKAVFIDPMMSKAWHNMGVMQLRQSANTWTQMLVHTQQSDPLYEKAERFSRDTLKALNNT